MKRVFVICVVVLEFIYVRFRRSPIPPVDTRLYWLSLPAMRLPVNSRAVLGNFASPNIVEPGGRSSPKLLRVLARNGCGCEKHQTATARP